MGKQLEFQALRFLVYHEFTSKIEEIFAKSKFQTFSQLCASSGFLQ